MCVIWWHHIRLKGRLSWEQDGLLISVSTSEIIQIPIVAVTSRWSATTREADTFIIGVAILSPIHVVVGVQTRRVNGKVNVEHDVLAHPIIHQGIQQVKIIRHICQSVNPWLYISFWDTALQWGKTRLTIDTSSCDMNIFLNNQASNIVVAEFLTWSILSQESVSMRSWHRHKDDFSKRTDSEELEIQHWCAAIHHLPTI